MQEERGHGLRQLSHIEELIKELNKWKTNRDRHSDLKSKPLERAAAYLEEYRDLLADMYKNIKCACKGTKIGEEWTHSRFACNQQED